LGCCSRGCPPRGPPELRSAVLHRPLSVEDERQYLVLDLDELERVFGNVAVDGSDDGHGLARIADRVVEHHALVLAVA
jgi:hypothetical protein